MRTVALMLLGLLATMPAWAQTPGDYSYRQEMENELYSQRQEMQRQLQQLRDEQDRMRSEAIEREAAMQQLIEDRREQQQLEDMLFQHHR